jgi:hypothetical protein
VSDAQVVDIVHIGIGDISGDESDSGDMLDPLSSFEYKVEKQGLWDTSCQ